MFPNQFAKVYICLPVEEDPGKELEYPVRVTEVAKNAFATEVPFDKNGYPIRLKTGFSSRVIFYHEDNMYRFEAELIGHKSDNIDLYVWKRPADKDIVKIQRRSYFRVPVSLDGKMSIEGQMKNIVVVDLSGGGLAFRDREKVLEKNQQVQGSLFIPLKNGTDREVLFIASVRRVLLEEQFFRFGLEFIKISESDRDRIIQHCLTRQREIRQRLM
ncbi:PilZ domain-containing protein [Alicyclobacillus tolerans]|uniref:flagellar brake protein n=1 Tax=Alicyclobacillus tolerans TaxID=90970 RepID=UPI001F019C8E|nr:PilZ domain-containing protein [Alicyclobacillus tolerans]MCF8567648.1 PilZ domain-containing protein [Alicyclobacillus tolerans]